MLWTVERVRFPAHTTHHDRTAQILPANSIVLAVDEDWSDGGAGNALGTFYA